MIFKSTLSTPAPAGGLTVDLTSDAPAVISVGPPSQVTIPQGGTTGQVSLNGVSAGATTIRATAAGYSDGAVLVDASAQVLSLPGTLNVPFGGTASIPVQCAPRRYPSPMDCSFADVQARCSSSAASR